MRCILQMKIPRLRWYSDWPEATASTVQDGDIHWGCSDSNLVSFALVRAISIYSSKGWPLNNESVINFGFKVFSQKGVVKWRSWWRSGWRLGGGTLLGCFGDEHFTYLARMLCVGVWECVHVISCMNVQVCTCLHACLSVCMCMCVQGGG